MSDLKEIRRLRALCKEYGLEGREVLANHTDEDLARLYNGIGPEAFPEWLRGVLDSLHPSLAPVAFIHDVEWSGSDGTEEGFRASNERFKRNGYRVARAMYGWWRPRRYLVMNDARRFGNLCQAFGWRAYLAPYDAKRAAKALADLRASEAAAAAEEAT